MIHSHWFKLLEGIQLSSQDFYKSLDEAILRREFPLLHRSRVKLPQGGILSSNREYVRFKREKMFVDICAAPVGTGSFVSCRLIEEENSWYLAFLAIFAIFVAVLVVFLLLLLEMNGIAAFLATSVIVLPPTAIVLILVLVAKHYLGGFLANLDSVFLSNPLFGSTYERITRRNTYYRIDLMCAFEAAVHAALFEVVDQQLEVQKLKPLSEIERKPVFSKLLGRGIR